MKKTLLFLSLFLLLAVTVPAFSQQMDVGFSVSTLVSPSASSSQLGFGIPPEKGGAYTGFNFGVIFHNRLGFNGEVSWRASQALYNGYQPYRPIFYDFNGVYQPRLGKRAGLDLMAGIGGEDIREYTNYYSCNFVSCTDYNSSNHFMGHIGGGFRYYFWHSFFIRPEAHLYIIHNNAEFSSGNIGRVGATLGYSLRPE